MPNTPPNSGKSPGEQPAVPVQKQLDDLLSKIETEEPGTLDPSVLPSSFQPAVDKAEENKPSEEKALVEPATPAAPEAAAEPANIEPAEAPSTTDAAEPTDEQAAMLAALNSALQGMNPGSEPEAQAAETSQAAEPAEAATETAVSLDADDELQQEIAALINGEPSTTTESPASEAPAADSNELSTEDQIAMEIEGLLNADQPAVPEEQPQPQQQQEVDETSIDELDQMLANEIDEDDELLGDFQTVEAITAGIETAEPAAITTDDEHAATARDVAAELDTQPEDLASQAKPAPGEDPFAALAEIAQTAEKNEQEYQERVRLSLPVWIRRFQEAKERLLKFCFALNWPARRFLTTEWRANLGYIALLNLFFGVGIWLYLIVR